LAHTFDLVGNPEQQIAVDIFDRYYLTIEDRDVVGPVRQGYAVTQRYRTTCGYKEFARITAYTDDAGNGWGS